LLGKISIWLELTPFGLGWGLDQLNHVCISLILKRV